MKHDYWSRFGSQVCLHLPCTINFLYVIWRKLHPQCSSIHWLQWYIVTSLVQKYSFSAFCRRLFFFRTYSNDSTYWCVTEFITDSDGIILCKLNNFSLCWIMRSFEQCYRPTSRFSCYAMVTAGWVWWVQQNKILNSLYDLSPLLFGIMNEREVLLTRNLFLLSSWRMCHSTKEWSVWSQKHTRICL